MWIDRLTEMGAGRMQMRGVGRLPGDMTVVGRAGSSEERMVADGDGGAESLEVGMERVGQCVGCKMAVLGGTYFLSRLFCTFFF